MLLFMILLSSGEHKTLSSKENFFIYLLFLWIIKRPTWRFQWKKKVKYTTNFLVLLMASWRLLVIKLSLLLSIKRNAQKPIKIFIYLFKSVLRQADEKETRNVNEICLIIWLEWWWRSNHEGWETCFVAINMHY